MKDFKVCPQCGWTYGAIRSHQIKMGLKRTRKKLGRPRCKVNFKGLLIRKRRGRVTVILNGNAFTLRELSHRLNISRSTLRRRLKPFTADYKPPFTFGKLPIDGFARI